jgi:hypothetical protein
MQHLEPRPTHINERPKLGTSLKLLNGRNWVGLPDRSGYSSDRLGRQLRASKALDKRFERGHDLRRREFGSGQRAVSASR